MASQLRVVSVAIKDVLGAREFSLEPGQVTVLRGKNGSGKSTALAAVQAAIGGGSLAKIARVDPEGLETEPEVVLVLEGPGSEHYRVERTGSDVRVRSRVGDTAALEDVVRPQSFLSSLFDGGCSNPVRFLTAPDKDRALMLLEALPLRFSRAALLAEMGIDARELLTMGSIPAGLHPLEEVALIREAVFRTRTGVNRDRTQQAASAEQLRRNLPAVLPEDVSEAITGHEAAVLTLAQAIARDEEAADRTAREAHTAASARYAQEQSEVSGAFKTAAAKLRQAAEARVAEIRAEAERQVAAVKAQVEGEIEQLRADGEARLAQAESLVEESRSLANEARQQAGVALAGRRERLAEARATLATLRAQADAAAKARGLQEQVVVFDAEAERLGAESERLTKALDALDAHRRRMAEDLPIPGLSIDGKVIRVNGVPFEQLNTAQKVEIAVKVATLRAKDQRLPVVWVDGAEALDSEHFDALVAALREAGVQAFLGRVTDEAFNVATLA